MLVLWVVSRLGFGVRFFQGISVLVVASIVVVRVVRRATFNFVHNSLWFEIGGFQGVLIYLTL